MAEKQKTSWKDVTAVSVLGLALAGLLVIFLKFRGML